MVSVLPQLHENGGRKGREFVESLSATDQCIEWPYAMRASGYGRIKYNHMPMNASRFVCLMFHGEPPPNKSHAAHECGNKACVNPRHISWKTPKENTADMVRHGTRLEGESHPRRKLNAVAVGEIRSLRGLMSQAKIAARYGVSVSAVNHVFSGRSWSNQ